MNQQLPTRVVVTIHAMTKIVHRLARADGSFVDIRASKAQIGEDIDWLIHDVATPAVPATVPTVRFTARPINAIERIALPEKAVVVSLPAQGAPTAQVVYPDGRHTPVILRVIAPGLPEHGSEPISRGGDQTRLRYSRQEGALGVYPSRRLQELSYAVIGCGRSGYQMAHALARRGVRRIVLIDNDCVDTHNSEYPIVLKGKFKAHALLETLEAVHDPMSAIALPYSISDVRAVEAALRCDVLCVCCDNDGARWTAAQISVRYLKLLLDIGVGVLPDGAQGADVRWVTPGERCLVCFGGMAQPAHITATQRGLYAEAQFQATRNWRSERRGSRFTLNELAVSLGLGMLEDYLRGEIQGSRWMRLLYENATPQINLVETGKPNECLCAQTAQGDREFPDRDASSVNTHRR